MGGLAKINIKGILILYFAIYVVSMVEGEVYMVGDSAGWTNIGHVDYITWSNTKHFHVGDTIIFEYNKQFHNVVRVTHKNYRACNATAPNYGTYTTGNDSFTVKHPGHYFFICSLPGHCQAGQKVNVRVPSLPAPAPAPHSSSSPSPRSSPNPSLSPRPIYNPSPVPKASPTPSPPFPWLSPSPSPTPSVSIAPPPKNSGSLPASKLWMITLVLSAFCVSSIAY